MSGRNFLPSDNLGKKTSKGIILLNPSEKSRKYADELYYNGRFTNDGNVKNDINGNPLRLSNTQRAYRSGYLQARKDNAKCYNAKKNKT